MPAWTYHQLVDTLTEVQQYPRGPQKREATAVSETTGYRLGWTAYVHYVQALLQHYRGDVTQSTLEEVLTHAAAFSESFEQTLAYVYDTPSSTELADLAVADTDVRFALQLTAGWTAAAEHAVTVICQHPDLPNVSISDV